MPRVNPHPRSLDDLTVGDLRRLVQWDGDESTTIDDALAAIVESARVSELHEIDVREFESYRTHRETRRAAALAEAAAAADKGARGHGDGAAMAARQAARVEAFQTFDQREPLLQFVEWQAAGRPDGLEVSVRTRAVQVIKELVA